MPQLDKLTFLSQFFWLSFFFISFYFFLLRDFLPKLTKILKIREKKLIDNKKPISGDTSSANPVNTPSLDKLFLGVITNSNSYLKKSDLNMWALANIKKLPKLKKTNQKFYQVVKNTIKKQALTLSSFGQSSGLAFPLPALRPVRPNSKKLSVLAFIALIGA